MKYKDLLNHGDLEDSLKKCTNYKKDLVKKP